MEPKPTANDLTPAKRALYEIRALKARLRELESSRNEPVAIVGLGVRLPGGASTPAAFWSLLDQGVDAIREIPAERWDVESYYDPDPAAPGKMYTRHGGFIEAVEDFDARFFGLSPREAVATDPQQRVLLETAWEALEYSGINPAGLTGTQTGVFLALSNSDYGRMLFGRIPEFDVYASTGSTFSVAAGRISYLLGLNGPAMVVDTACSGSLVAVHLAIQSLRTGECNLALAGGVNLILAPEVNINFCRGGLLAADGRCRSFDERAGGYVRSEGCGVIVLKRLSDALSSNDNILAVLRGSAINQDGRSGGLTVPNGPAQEAVIRQALANSGVEALEVSYIEAHGTGTSLGDPIEAHALAAVYGPGRQPENPLVVGSVKSNIGHIEAAAGIAGLIKVVLSLGHERIPPHLHFVRMNPHIDWRGMPVEIPSAGRAWPKGEHPRRAGVSSFGFSGTNAHVIVEEAPAVAPQAAHSRALEVLTLSARSDRALSELEQRYREWLPASAADTRRPVLHGQYRKGAVPRSGRVSAERPRTAGRSICARAQRAGAGGGVPLYRAGSAIRRHGTGVIRDRAGVPRGDGALRPGGGREAGTGTAGSDLRLGDRAIEPDAVHPAGDVRHRVCVGAVVAELGSGAGDGVGAQRRRVRSGVRGGVVQRGSGNGVDRRARAAERVVGGRARLDGRGAGE